MNTICKLVFSALLLTPISPTVFGQTFSDVPEDYWAYPFIEELVAKGITGGCGGGNYCPDVAVTRAQMAVFLVRVMSGQQHHSFISVPGVALQSNLALSDVIYLADGTMTAADLGNTFASGPVQLPDQMRVLGMRCWLRDPDPTGYIQVQLLRHAFSSPSFTAEVLASTGTTPAAAASGFLEQSAIASADKSVVDNANFAYFFSANLIDVTALGDGIAFRGCSVEMGE